MNRDEKPYYLRQLERTFENRAKINPRYSLRAFARDLGFSAARLSGVLNQKFGLSRASAEELCAKLKYDAKVKEAFVISVQAHHERSPKARALAKMKLAGRRRVFDQLELDRFAVISEWYHFALMEFARYTKLKISDHRLIAKELGISLIEAKGAIERLLGVGLLKVEGERLVRTGSYFAGDQNPSPAIRAINTQLIQKALDSIHQQTIEERDLRTVTMAVSKNKMPEFNRLFDQFQKQVSALAASETQKTDVYAWTMQFYRLSERKNT